MKIANTLVVSFISLVLTFAVSDVAFGFDNFKDFRKDHWDFDLSSDYFRTESNFNSGGSQESLPNGNYYQLTNFNLKTRYVSTARTAWYLSGNIGMAESKGYTGTRTNTAFNEVIAGAEYVAYSGGFDLIPEFSILIPTEKTAVESGEKAFTAEGVIEARPKITLQKAYGPYGAYGYGGFTYRAEGRSFLLPWGVGAFLRLADSRFGVELSGFQSMTDDDSTKNKANRLAQLSKVDGGSYKFASFNPSLVDATVFYHSNTRGRWSFELSGGLPLTGNNAANGYHVGALIRLSFDLTSVPQKVFHYSPTTPRDVPKGRSQMYGQEDPPLVRKSSNKFSEDTGDGVDQTLFKPKALTPKKDTRLQKQLDDVEMEIELKGPKKKKRKK